MAPDGTSFALSGIEDAPVLTFIHGLGLSQEIWADMLPSFQKCFRVLTYDLYGHGKSAPLQEGTVSLRAYSDQLAGLLRHLSIPRTTVIGFSIGGMINRRFAQDHAEMVEALVILNSPHNRGAGAQKLVEDRARKVRSQGAFATFEEALKRWFTPEFLADTRVRAPKLVREWRAQVDAESYAQAAWVLAAGVLELVAPDPKITVPALVISCENDSGCTPAMSEAIAAEIEDADIEMIPGLQHLGLMEQPDRFIAPILKFLSSKA